MAPEHKSWGALSSDKKHKWIAPKVKEELGGKVGLSRMLPLGLGVLVDGDKINRVVSYADMTEGQQNEARRAESTWHTVLPLEKGKPKTTRTKNSDRWAGVPLRAGGKSRKY